MSFSAGDEGHGKMLIEDASTHDDSPAPDNIQESSPETHSTNTDQDTQRRQKESRRKQDQKRRKQDQKKRQAPNTEPNLQASPTDQQQENNPASNNDPQESNPKPNPQASRTGPQQQLNQRLAHSIKVIAWMETHVFNKDLEFSEAVLYRPFSPEGLAVRAAFVAEFGWESYDETWPDL